MCREHRERHALEQRHTWDPSSAGRYPPGHRLRAGQGGAGGAAGYEGGSRQRTLLLKIRSNNANDGTPEEGLRLPGQALLFASTHHSTISLRTRRCLVKG